MSAAEPRELPSPFATKGAHTPSLSGSSSFNVRDTLCDLRFHDSGIFGQDRDAPEGPIVRRKKSRSRKHLLRNLFGLRTLRPSDTPTATPHGPNHHGRQDVAKHGLPTLPEVSPERELQGQPARQISLGDGRDLFVQVSSARGLAAADMNGFSDPYCVVRLGKHRSKTKVITKSLSPIWNETFVFPAAEVKAALESSSIISFEVWDSDTLSDDFLGQADLDLLAAPLQTSMVEKQQIALHALKHGKWVEGNLGTIEVAVWRAPTGQFGRLGQADQQGASGKGAQHQTSLLTLCAPPGVGKKLPYTVSAAGNTLFEEPCICYLPLLLAKVRCQEPSKRLAVEQSAGSWTSRLSRTSRSTGSQGSGKVKVLDKEKSPPNHKSSWKERARPTFKHSALSDSGRRDPSSTGRPNASLDEQEDESRSSPRSIFSEPGEQSELVFPADDPEEAEPTEFGDHINPGDQNVPDRLKARALLYFEISLGGQKHRSRLSRLQDGEAVWEQDLVFVATLPLRNRALRLRLLLTDSNKRRGRLVAHAFIPLADLLPQTREGIDCSRRDCHYFRLHEEPGEANKFFRDAAVKLGMATVDHDRRRAMYDQPLLETTTAGERRLMHDLSMEERHASMSTASGMLPGDLNNDFENLSQALGVRQGQAGALARGDSGSSPTPASARAPEEASWSQHGGAENMELLDTRDSSMHMYSGSFKRPREPRAQLLRKVFDPGLAAIRELPDRLPPVLRWLTACLYWLLLPIWWPLQKLAAAMGSVVGRLLARLPEREQQLKRRRPLGIVKLVLQSIELEAPEAVFCVLKCGPHWGRSSTLPHGGKPAWNWEVHLPLYDPDTLLLLAVFSDPSKGRLFSHGGPQLVGKLRLRLSTVAAGRWHRCHLPMLAERRQGGTRKATANLGLEVVYFHPQGYLKSYLKAAQPEAVYRYGLHEGLPAKWLAAEIRSIVLRWLDAQAAPHTLPHLVAKAILDRERSDFNMSRARANWRRVALMRNKMHKVVVALRYVQSWQAPMVSLSCMVALVLLSYSPHIIVSLLLLFLACYGWLHHPPDAGAPLPMESDPEAEEDNEEVASSVGNPYTALKRKYDQLQRAALAAQSSVDDVAQLLERLHATVSWTDPHATMIFVVFCFVASVAVAVVPWAFIQAFALCFMIRPPFMRTPTPPPPVSFFKRLPTKADQII